MSKSLALTLPQPNGTQGYGIDHLRIDGATADDLFRHLPVAALVVDSSALGILAVNPAASERLGESGDALRGRPVQALFPLDGPILRALLDEALLRATPAVDLLRPCSSNGGPHLARVSVCTIRLQGETSLLVVIEDDALELDRGSRQAAGELRNCRMLVKLGLELARERNRVELANVIARNCEAVLAFEQVAILTPLPGDLGGRSEVSPIGGILDRALYQNESVCISRRSEVEDSRFREWMSAAASQSCLVEGLRSIDRRLGILVFASSVPGAFGGADLPLAREIAQLASSALERCLLSEDSAALLEELSAENQFLRHRLKLVIS